MNECIITRKQPLLYGDNQIISSYHKITVHKKEEKCMAVLSFCTSFLFRRGFFFSL